MCLHSLAVIYAKHSYIKHEIAQYILRQGLMVSNAATPSFAI